ncbi:MAG: GNAT family N-acetyltransferase [Acholeplasmataceae bacterium]|nr:GNAT family N-acetyltransferase [Acholeplasmataceae bacterium]
MITLKEVRSFWDSHRFTEFPNRLYKHVEPFVPALSLDERNVFNPKKNPVHEYCDAIRFLAYRNNKIVGRIAGIINHRLNEAFGKKEVRFTRLDMIDDIEVTKTLIEAVTNWGKERGMDTLIGPIGFTDMDRQGMLVDGFDQLNMFITIYNHKYYMEHLEKLGFVKDVDWTEKIIQWPKEVPEKVRRGAEITRKRYGYELVKCHKKKDLFKYVYEAFDMYNIAFQELYGFFPLPKPVIDYYIKQVLALVQLDYIWFVLDKDKNVVAFTVIMPSLAKANKKNNGHLFPFGFLRIFKALRKHDVIDLYFIAIHPDHQGKGLIALMFEDGIEVGIKNGVIHAETGPELELNANIQNQWKTFDFVEHKRRRCYTKPI